MRLRRFAKYCLVGGAGVLVDMAVLHFLAEPDWFGWPVVVSKVCSAETALLNNFLWNEFWTFRDVSEHRRTLSVMLKRLLKFHAICVTGIVWAVLLLALFHSMLGLNLYAANLGAIGLVTIWNFWMNSRFNWQAGAG